MSYLNERKHSENVNNLEPGALQWWPVEETASSHVKFPLAVNRKEKCQYQKYDAASCVQSGSADMPATLYCVCFIVPWDKATMHILPHVCHTTCTKQDFV